MFNTAQLQILDMMSFVKSEDALQELKQVISDYFAQKAQAEIDRLWEIGELNEEKVELRVDGNVVKLTPMEYKILLLLMKNPGKVFSPKDIYKMVWEDIPLGSEGTVAVHIRHLREKIEINPSEPRYLKVVWGQGYKLEE